MEHCILQEKKNQHFVTDKCSSFQVTSLLLTTYFNYFAFNDQLPPTNFPHAQQESF